MRAESKEPPALKDEASLPISWKNPSLLSSRLVTTAGFWWRSSHPGPYSGHLSSLPPGEGSRQLLDAKVKLISNAVCNSRRLYDHMLDDNMICAGNLQKPGQDSCQVRDSKGHLGEAGRTLHGARRALRALGWEAGSEAHLPQREGEHICPPANLNPHQPGMTQHNNQSAHFVCIV